MNIKDRVILDGSMNFPRFMVGRGTYNQNGEIRDILTPKLPPKTLIRLTAKAATGTILFGGYANLLFIKKGGNLI